MYGCINELTNSSINTHFTAPHDGATAWFGGVQLQAMTGAALGDGYTLKIKLTPKGESYEKIIRIHFVGCCTCDYPIELEPDTDVEFWIVATAGDTDFMVDAKFIIAREF